MPRSAPRTGPEGHCPKGVPVPASDRTGRRRGDFAEDAGLPAGRDAAEAFKNSPHHHQSTCCPWWRCHTTHDVQTRTAARLAINDPAENATMVSIVSPYSRPLTGSLERPRATVMTSKGPPQCTLV